MATRRSTETVFFAKVSSFMTRGRNWLQSFVKDGRESQVKSVGEKYMKWLLVDFSDYNR